MSFTRNQRGHVLTDFIGKMGNICKFDCPILTWMLSAVSLTCTHQYQTVKESRVTKLGLVLFTDVLDTPILVLLRDAYSRKYRFVRKTGIL